MLSINRPSKCIAITTYYFGKIFAVFWTTSGDPSARTLSSYLCYCVHCRGQSNDEGDTDKSNDSTEAQLGSEERDISDDIESSEIHPFDATSRDVESLNEQVKTVSDEAVPNASMEEVATDQQTTVGLEAVASEISKDEEKGDAKQETLHPAVPTVEDTLDSQLVDLLQSPSIQESEGSKQSKLQATSQDAQVTLNSELVVLLNSPSIQESQGSKQSKIQVTNQDAQNTVDSQLAVLLNSPSIQETEDHKQSKIQVTRQDSQDTLHSQLVVLMNLPSIQESQGSEQLKIQVKSQDSQDASQTVKNGPTENSLIGRRICKKFAGEYHEGKVAGYDSATKLFKISYCDLDEEELDLIGVQLWLAAEDHDYSTDKRFVTEKAVAEHSESPSKKAKKSCICAPKKKRTTTMNLESPQTPVKGTKTSPEAMLTHLNIDENAQSVQQTSKTTPESSQEKCTSSPPTSPINLTTGHNMETAGSATNKKKRQQKSRQQQTYNKRSKETLSLIALPI